MAAPQLELHNRKTFDRFKLPKPSTLYYTVLLICLAFVVLYPILLIALNTFQVGRFGTQTTFGFENWRIAFEDPKLKSSLIKTISLALSRQAIAVAVGIFLAWLIAMTDLPGKKWFEFGFWIAVFMPVLSVTLSWILILDNFNGLANRLVELLPFVDKGPFNIYSYWGIQWVHLMTGTLPVKIMLLSPAFRNMDSSLEEASRIAGRGAFGTLMKITIPIMTPAILISVVLGIIRSLEAFEVELILGVPQKIDVYSTMIYRLVVQSPPQYGAASVLSIVALLFVLPMVLLQQYISSHKNYATVSGKHSSRLFKLGRWKWPAFVLVGCIIAVMTVIPAIMLLLSTFTKIFGHFEKTMWTLDHWKTILDVTGFTKSLLNTLIISGGGALLTIPLVFLIAYISVRTKYRGRGAIDFLSWLTTTVPGIIMGLSFLWLFLKTPILKGMYGTVGVLILVVILANMTLGAQLIKSTMVQIGNELEEASLISGASWLYTLRRIIFPLVAPAVTVVFVYTFASAAKTVSYFALLSTPKNKPLALLQLDMMADGSLEKATVVGVILLVLTVGAALVAKAFGMNSELRH